MIATSEDVAKRAGVSRGAVSQILNGRGQRFSSSTRERVLSAAAELEYQPSAAGRALANGSSDFVIVLVPNTTFGTNLQGLFEDATAALAEHGLTLVLHLSTQSSAALGRLVAGIKPRAVISLVPFSPSEREVLERRSVAALDPAATSRNATDLLIGRLQATHLLERGFERIVVARLHDARQDPFGDARLRGAREACEAAGIAAPRQIQLGIDLPAAVAALSPLANERVGIACYNDDVALTLLSAARLLGLQVPGDVGLIGMDNTALSQISVPRLTTISYDVSQTSATIVNAIMQGLGLSHTPAAGTSEPALSVRSGDST